jgi:hypothetical protein
MNLKEETLEELKSNGKFKKDVLFVTNGFAYISFKSFLDISEKIEYDNGYGSAKIDLDLKIVGKDWWLERYEYDGSEWWVFKKHPEKPKVCEKFIFYQKEV